MFFSPITLYYYSAQTFLPGFLRKLNYVLFTDEKSIIFSWLWEEIVSVMGVSSEVFIVIVVMNIRLIFWGGNNFIFCLFCWYGNEEYWLNDSG